MAGCTFFTLARQIPLKSPRTNNTNHTVRVNLDELQALAKRIERLPESGGDAGFRREVPVFVAQDVEPRGLQSNAGLHQVGLRGMWFDLLHPGSNHQHQRVQWRNLANELQWRHNLTDQQGFLVRNYPVGYDISKKPPLENTRRVS